MFTVKGMTCTGCMTKVTNAVTGLDGVNDVDVDISNGELTVLSETPVDADRIRQAIKEVGYEVVS
ncbi:heavy-metal-associated domain-containing protein [Kibdelosporangium persicum]|uniref:heavy-metal-associated domain-containing protein n=1 Tax=Kibdelosporangium persicum TaxID=2698649 RepID=UPI0028B200A4|nr:heavy metal-associated domain-containing protein [Kibdelosporangium persicum]